MSKLSQHMHLAHECMDKFGALNLLELSELEQTLATGKTEDGDSPKIDKLIASTEKMLATVKKPVDKLRLLLVLIISRQGLQAADKDRLWDIAKVTPEQQKVFDNIRSHLDIPIYQTEEVAAKKGGVLGGWFG
jgi:syntaxin-binding protein 1